MGFKSTMGAAMALCVLPVAANATTLNATGTVQGIFYDFSIDYNDSNGNSLLDLGEITSFSGATITPFTYSNIYSVANIPGFASGPGTFWGFDDPSGYSNSVNSIFWTYSVTNVNPIPLPSAFPLLAAGLGALAVFGRRRKRRA